VLDAIATRTPIFFTYLSQDLEKLPRQVRPYAIASKGGHWYFAGFDIEKAAMRTFRLDRVSGEITIGAETNSFEIPQGFDLLQNFTEDSRNSTAILEVRKDKAFVLRNEAKVLKDLGEWELISVEYSNSNTFIDQVLWHMDDVFIVEPKELQNSITEVLEKLVVLHE
jgi:predicted DNA-binding transcriptional regulator YafY